MNILILGYGYSGYHCAKILINNNHNVTAVSRSYPAQYQLENLQHISSDIRELNINTKPDAILYCVPPPSSGIVDSILSETLIELKNKKLVANIIYWGSSGVYGDHNSEWVNEDSECNIKFDLQRRRLDAESQIQTFAKESNRQWTIMRVAGMYGAHRLSQSNNPVIKIEQAPYSNMIYIKDAAKVAVSCLISDSSIGLINVSDGVPLKMGSLQRLISKEKHLRIIEKDYQKILATASPMRKYFLSSSKKLSNDKCKLIFPEIKFSSLTEVVSKHFQQ